ncbi:MAG: hypothetical protein ACI8WB_002786 [Phenylobacterium sp.]|jgi:hypothetical protein
MLTYNLFETIFALVSKNKKGNVMKTHRIKTKQSLIVSAIFLLASSSCYAKKVVITPVDGVSLHEIMLEISTYRTCMDEVQTTATKRGRSAYNKAQSQQCHDAFVGLGQLVDKHSLKSIDNLSWHRWRKREFSPAFSTDRLLKNPSALLSGVKK